MARLFSRNVSPQNAKKVSLSPGTGKKQPKNQFYPKQNKLDKSIATACDVVQLGLLAGCCAPLKVLYIRHSFHSVHFLGFVYFPFLFGSNLQVIYFSFEAFEKVAIRLSLNNLELKNIESIFLSRLAMSTR